MKFRSPYDSYRHLLALRMLAPEDYEAVATLWDAYRRADKRAKKLEYMMDKIREKESDNE